MAVIPYVGLTVPGQNMQATVIAVSNLRCQSIRLRIALDKLTHLPPDDHESDGGNSTPWRRHSTADDRNISVTRR